jgi:O-methyltransferase
MADKEFSFVNLDVDLYESTFASLEFFYPRLAKGAILMSHDYSTCAGVKRAFYAFYKGRPEPVIALCGSQCLVVKL